MSVKSKNIVREWTVKKEELASDNLVCKLERTEYGFKGYITALTLNEELEEQWRKTIRAHHPEVTKLELANIDDLHHTLHLQCESEPQAKEVLEETAHELDVIAFPNLRHKHVK